MPENITRQSALDQLLLPGDYFAAGREPGLVIEERRDVVQLQMIARHGTSAKLARSLSSLLSTDNILAPRHGALHKGTLIW